MNEEKNNAPQEEPMDENPWDEFGWEFHKIPILASVILVVLFYLFVFFWISL